MGKFLSGALASARSRLSPIFSELATNVYVHDGNTKKNDKKRDENQPKSANSGPQSRPTSPQVGPLQVRPEHRLEHIRGSTGLHNNSKPPSTEHNNDIWSFRTAIQANG